MQKTSAFTLVNADVRNLWLLVQILKWVWVLESRALCMKVLVWGGFFGFRGVLFVLVVFEQVLWLPWVVDLLETVVLSWNSCMTRTIPFSWKQVFMASYRKLIVQVLALQNQPWEEFTKFCLSFYVLSFKFFNFHGYIYVQWILPGFKLLPSSCLKFETSVGRDSRVIWLRGKLIIGDICLVSKTQPLVIYNQIPLGHHWTRSSHLSNGDRHGSMFWWVCLMPNGLFLIISVSE